MFEIEDAGELCSRIAEEKHVQNFDVASVRSVTGSDVDELHTNLEYVARHHRDVLPG